MSSFLAKVKQQKLLSVTLLLATLLVGILIGALINTGVNAAKDETSPVASDATPIKLPQAQPVGNEFSKLAKRLEPSVVYIHSDYLVKPDKQAKKARETLEVLAPLPAGRQRDRIYHRQKRLHTDQRSRDR